jgi:hypothetical protein
LSRDIRNTLSEALVLALTRADRQIYLHTAEDWLDNISDAAHAAYIQDRLIRYDRALDQITSEKIGSARHQAIILWNNRLFFEVHEHLEQIWHQTTGEEHLALKGLIQAAGVYVHLEVGNRPAAAKLAVKSLQRLEKYSGYLRFIDNLNLLVDKLENLDDNPPDLVIGADHQLP